MDEDYEDDFETYDDDFEVSAVAAFQATQFACLTAMVSCRVKMRLTGVCAHLARMPVSFCRH